MRRKLTGGGVPPVNIVYNDDMSTSDNFTEAAAAAQHKADTFGRNVYMVESKRWQGFYRIIGEADLDNVGTQFVMVFRPTPNHRKGN